MHNGAYLNIVVSVVEVDANDMIYPKYLVVEAPTSRCGPTKVHICTHELVYELRRAKNSPKVASPIIILR